MLLGRLFDATEVVGTRSRGPAALFRGEQPSVCYREALPSAANRRKPSGAISTGRLSCHCRWSCSLSPRPSSTEARPRHGGGDISRRPVSEARGGQEVG